MTPETAVTVTDCERQRLACEKYRVRKQQTEETERLAIKSRLESLNEKMDAVLDLARRVVTLELWRSRLNGAAEEAARAAHAEHPHHRVGEQGEHDHQRTVDAVLAVLAATAKVGEDKPAADWRVKIMWGLGLFAAGSVGAPILGAIGQMIAARLMK